jgi:hypothetical protein
MSVNSRIKFSNCIFVKYIHDVIPDPQVHFLTDENPNTIHQIPKLVQVCCEDQNNDHRLYILLQYNYSEQYMNNVLEV